jgi:hypothetical protein
MATHDYVIANGTGAAVRSDLNDALAAIVSNNSGSSEPGTTYAYQWWADTNANVLKIRNSANNAWITLRELDGTMLIEDGTESAPGLAFADDTNTGLFSPAADSIALTTGGGERFRLNNSEAVFNEDSDDYDFRVESNGDANMLFVHGENNRVGIGTDSPGAKFSVFDSSSAQFRLETPGVIAISHTFDGTDYTINNNDGSSGHSIIFGTKTSGAESLRIDTSGRLLVGTSNAISGSSTNDNLQLVNSAGSILSVASSDTTISSGTRIGEIEFWGQPGSTWGHFASITVKGDGSAAANDNPGRIEFGTTADGQSTPTERMRLNNEGKLLIGSDTGSFHDDRLLQVGKTDRSQTYVSITTSTSGTGGLLFADTTTNDTGGYRGQITYQHSSDAMVFSTSASEAVRIDSGGLVGIGHSSPQFGLTLAQTSNNSGAIGWEDSSSNKRASIRCSGSTDALQFAIGSSDEERMRITPQGYLKASHDGGYMSQTGQWHEFTGTLANSYTFRADCDNSSPLSHYVAEFKFSATSPNNGNAKFLQCRDNTGAKINLDSDGGIHNYQSNDGNLCDEREKKNIVSLDTKWDKVKSWELKKFHYNEDADTDDLRYGVIAQQVEEHCPEVICDWIKQKAEDAVLDDDGNVETAAVAEVIRKGVKEQQMMWMAIKALQEAQARIETLEAKVAALEAG